MTVSVEIVPFADSLDMYGDPDRSAAYSLSGHVALSLSSTTSIFGYGYARPSQLLLSSLVVTFEGQSEMVAEETGYSAVRLCSISQECVSGEPVELMTNDVPETSDNPCTWNVVFNLTVPGWLPATDMFGQKSFTGPTGTRYGLHAVAKFQYLPSTASNSWFSLLCLPLRFTSQTAKAPRVAIALNRFISPSSFASTSSSLFPTTNYAVTVQSEECIGDPPPSIPTEILSKLRVVVSIPEQVGTEEEMIPLSIRMRTEGLSESECKRLRAEEFLLALDQTEKYRSVPLSAYSARYPLPPRSQQPPNMPLLDPNPMQTIYEMGLSACPPPRQVLSRTFSLLPTEHSRRFVLAGDGYIFDGDSNTSDVTWYSLSTNIAVAKERETTDEKDWKQIRALRESGHSPFFSVQHQLSLSLKCTYDLSEGENPERATRHLSFNLPIRFVRTPPVISRGHSPSSSCCPSLLSLADTCSEPSTPTSDFLPPSLPYTNTLPAYSQLFESNGDRKIDYSIPLPLYTPRPSADEKCQASSGQLEDISLRGVMV